jgi:hypothetical protein
MGGGGTAADHVLVAAANIGGDHLENDAVLTLAVLLGQGEVGKADIVDLDLAWACINDTAIACHSALLFKGKLPKGGLAKRLRPGRA